MARLPRLLRDAQLVQRRIVEAVRDEDISDDAFAAYLAEAGVPRVSRPLVTLWANAENTRWMRVADVLGAMRLTARPERILQPLCDAANGVFVPLPGGVGEPIGVRCALALGGLIGRLQEAVLDARHPDSDGGEDVTEDEREQLLGLIDEAIRQLTKMRASLSAYPREVA